MEDIVLDRAALGAAEMEPPMKTGELRVLTAEEMDDVSGGFVCGGLCIAGAAFAAGAIVGGGVVTGYYSAKRS